MDFKTAEKVIQTNRWLEHHTHLIKSEKYVGAYAIRYKLIEVVVIFPNGKYLINTNGLRTEAIKHRINRYSPLRIIPKYYRTKKFKGRKWLTQWGDEIYDRMLVDEVGHIMKGAFIPGES